MADNRLRHRGDIAVSAGVHNTTLWKNTERFQDFIIALVEAIWNERDAWNQDKCGDPKIVIQFIERGKGRMDLRIYGNGEGIVDSGLSDIVSLNQSTSASDPSKRGKAGQGSKSFCWHAERLIVETIRCGENALYRISYTAQELIEMWDKGEDVRWGIYDIPADCIIQGHGTCFSWENIGKGMNVDPRHDRSLKRVVTELAEELPPDLASSIIVIGPKMRKHKLAPRSIRGDMVEGVADIEKVGQVAYQIAVTQRQVDRDELMLWAHDKVGSIRDFLNRVHPSPSISPLLDAISVTLDHPHVIGSLMIPSWNKFVSSDRGGWVPSFFDNEDVIFAFLKWLYNEIVPLVESKTGQDRDRAISDNETIRNALVEEFQQVGGAPDTDRQVADVTLKSKLELSRSRIILEPGQSIDIAIEHPEPDKTYSWDASEALGRLNTLRGPQVTFTAGRKTGTGKLTVKGNGKSAEITIKVVRELPFCFLQGSRHNIEPGQLITHTLQVPSTLQGQPLWDSRGSGGTLKVARDGLSATHLIGEKEGTFEVTVRGQTQKGTRLTSTCTIFVAHKGERPQKTRRTSRTEFIWDGVRYELSIRNHRPKHEGEEWEVGWLYEGLGDRPTRIALNFAHPIYNSSDEVRRAQAITQIALCIAQDQVRRNPTLLKQDPTTGAGQSESAWLRQRAGQIQVRLLDASA